MFQRSVENLGTLTFTDFWMTVKFWDGAYKDK